MLSMNIFNQVMFKNFLLVIEVVLSSFWSSATVERGFNTVNQSSNSRLSMLKTTLDNIMIICINISILTEIKLSWLIKQFVSIWKCYVIMVQSRKTKLSYHSKDLFLPITSSSLLETNPLLADDNYLYPISQSESDDEGCKKVKKLERVDWRKKFERVDWRKKFERVNWRIMMI